MACYASLFAASADSELVYSPNNTALTASYSATFIRMPLGQTFFYRCKNGMRFFIDENRDNFTGGICDPTTGTYQFPGVLPLCTNYTNCTTIPSTPAGFTAVNATETVYKNNASVLYVYP